MMLRVSKSILPIKKLLKAQGLGFEQYAFKPRSGALSAVRAETES